MTPEERPEREEVSSGVELSEEEVSPAWEGGETFSAGEYEEGDVQISDEVVAVIAGIAATEVEGVAGMSGGFVGGISEMLGKKNLSKGVKVEVGEREAALDLFVIVDYAVRIPKVAKDVQETVKRAVEKMTGLNVVEANIHIQGVAFQEDEGGTEVRVK